MRALLPAAISAALLAAAPAGADAPTWAELCAANSGNGVIAFCVKALEEDPENLSLRRHFAKSLLLGGAEVRALKEYRRIAERRPDDADAQFDLAVACASIYRFRDAAEAAERAIALRPDHDDAMMVAAIAYQMLGRHAAAFSVYLRLAERGNVLGMWDVATSLERGRGVAKDNARALHWMTRAAEAEHVGALERLAEVYRLGELGVEPDAAMAEAWAARATATRSKPPAN